MSAVPAIMKDQVVNNVSANLRKDLKNRQRVNEYFRANIGTEELLLRLAGVGGLTFAACAGSGAMIGGLAGGAKGALIGFGVGAGTGIIITCIYGGVKIRANFNDWKASVQDTCVTDAFREILTSDERFRDFWCPITLELLEDPTITKCGHTFEKVPLLDHFKTNGKYCPKCMQSVDPEELSTNIVMIGRIKQAFSDISDEFLQSNEEQKCSSEVQQAFEALNKDVDIQVDEVFDEVVVKLAIAKRDKKITKEEYLEQTKQLEVLLGKTSEEKK